MAEPRLYCTQVHPGLEVHSGFSVKDFASARVRLPFLTAVLIGAKAEFDVPA